MGKSPLSFQGWKIPVYKDNKTVNVLKKLREGTTMNISQILENVRNLILNSTKKTQKKNAHLSLEPNRFKAVILNR